MQIIIYILCSILILYIFVQIWQCFVVYQYKDDVEEGIENWPFISIWVAARNEENNIGKCLKALCELDYPIDKLQILVGNDQSTDNTEKIIDEFCVKNTQIKKVNIVNDSSGLKAKARVMAQIDKFAIGDFYLITDADVQVKPNWAKQMVLHMKPEIGVASGTTMVIAGNIWDKLQSIDWAYFMGLLNIISYSGVPATAVGNNMIVRKRAYEETGGYSAIKFSITEDYKLYSEICKRGWKWNNIMIPDLLAYSASTKNLFELLHQRKRWLSGGKELPWYWWLLFGVFGLYYFIIPSLLIININLYLILFIIFVKLFFQLITINKIYKHIGERVPNIISHLIYELYLFFITIGTAIIFILPVKTIWKGRKY